MLLFLKLKHVIFRPEPLDCRLGGHGKDWWAGIPRYFERASAEILGYRIPTLTIISPFGSKAPSRQALSPN